MQMTHETQSSPRDYLAAERTFLAWIRTGAALIGLGFVLARFGLFLQEFNYSQPNVHVASYGLSLSFGTSLIFLGALACIFSLVRYLRLINLLKRGEISLGGPSTLAVVVALLLAVLGLAMGYYLIITRPTAQTNIIRNKENFMATTQENGIVRVQSSHSVEDTVTRLQEILQAKGVKLFAIVDHSGEADLVGLKMPPTKLLIFGNPKAGTPLMLASPSVALDLPLKILVAEDAAGKTWTSYNASAFLQSRHNLPKELLPNIDVIEALAAKASE